MDAKVLATRIGGDEGMLHSCEERSEKCSRSEAKTRRPRQEQGCRRHPTGMESNKEVDGHAGLPRPGTGASA